jgi:hypothetical protein
MNISTRVPVGTADQVGIAGFILQGNAAKKVMVRAIGPSMNINGTPVAGRLGDPMLALHNKDGALIASNDDWRTSQEADIAQSGLAPADERESAILMRLDSANYTAIIRGAGESTGIGLVEVYDMESGSAARLANISTRGQVEGGDDLLIGGFIVRGDSPQKVLLRAIGPDLTSKDVPGALQDPTMELYDENGALLMENDNWKESQQAEIEATGIPPNDERESAIVRVLGAGNYTAVVRGKDNSTGVALVEAYHLGNP